VRPYPKRNATSERIGTAPDLPTTSRMSCGAPESTDMKSTGVTVPSRYARVTCLVRPHGRIRQKPLSSVPRRAAKQASESKRGRQSQSIDPSRANERGALAVADQRVILDP
jgi:hypothetical protein